MKETACLFGATHSLVGVMTHPPAEVDSGGQPAVILLNSALIHRVGPHRLYVRIARHLAAAGCLVLRFDLSGIGDSAVRHDNLPYETSAIRDTQEAMHFLSATTGVQHFILMGICAGADNAMRVADTDTRVVGVVLMDGYAFPTLRYFLRSYCKRLCDVRSWWNMLTGTSDLWGILRDLLLSRAAKLSQPQAHDWEIPSPEKIIATVRAFVERGGDVCFIYSAGSPAYYNYRRHLWRALSPLTTFGKVRVEFFSQSDHTYTLLTNQELLLRTLLDWVQSMLQNHGTHTRIYQG